MGILVSKQVAQQSVVCPDKSHRTCGGCRCRLLTGDTCTAPHLPSHSLRFPLRGPCGDNNGGRYQGTQCGAHLPWGSARECRVRQFSTPYHFPLGRRFVRPPAGICAGAVRQLTVLPRWCALEYRRFV